MTDTEAQRLARRQRESRQDRDGSAGEHGKDKKGKQGGGGESSLTVLLALAANVAVCIAKLVAGLITGSGALLSEAAHSAGDSTTEVLLWVALKRSEKPADRRHPFGYGKERYFWSLIAAGAIFVSGAAFSIYEGLHTIFGNGGESAKDAWINYLVLGAAALFEGTSFIQAYRQVHARAKRTSRSIRRQIFAGETDDPTANSVAMEDSAALIGLAIAAGGVGLHQATGDPMWDGIASLLIGCLLLVVAFFLARTCEGLLIGRQASERLLAGVSDELEAQPEILDVVDLLSMVTGTGRVLLCVRADFQDGFGAQQIEDACLRIDATLREKFDVLDEVFIQPVRRDNRELRDRVVARYGRALAEE